MSSPIILRHAHQNSSAKRQTIMPGPDLGLQMILKRVKTSLRSRGIHVYVNLKRKLQSIFEAEGLLNQAGFKKALRDSFGVPALGNVSDAELRLLYEYLISRAQDEEPNPEDVIYLIREPLSTHRLGFVNAVFTALDLDCDGLLSPHELNRIYDGREHPDVIHNLNTAENVKLSFLESFDIGGEVEGKVTRNEFVNYYTNIGACIDDDEYFEQIARGVWKVPPQVLNGGTSPRQNRSRPLHVKPTVDPLVIKLKNGGTSAPSGVLPGTLPAQSSLVPLKLGGSKVHTKKAYIHEPSIAIMSLIFKLRSNLRNRGGYAYVNLQRLLGGTIGATDEGNLSLSEFKKAIRDCLGTAGVGSVTDAELRKLYEHLQGRDGENEVTPNDVITLVREPLSKRRLDIVYEAFSKQDPDNAGVVEASNMAHNFHAAQHPDVIHSKFSADDIYKLFLQTFDVGGEVEGKVTRNEFVNYYTNIGAFIDDDEYFEQMIRGVWDVPAHPTRSHVQLENDQDSGFQPHTVGYAGMEESRYIGNDELYPDRTEYASSTQYPQNNFPAIGIQNALTMTREQLSAQGRFAYVILQRKLLSAQSDRESSLSVVAFKKSFRETMETNTLVGVSEEEICLLYEYLQRASASGDVLAEDVINLIRIPLTQRRTDVVNEAFSILDHDNDGLLSASDLINAYSAENHPDVLVGRRSPHEVSCHLYYENIFNFNDFINC